MDNPFLVIIASLLAGGGIGYLAMQVLTILASPRIIDPEKGRFEAARRRELRAASWTYRHFEPWIDELAPQVSGRRPQLEKKLLRDMAAAAERTPWEPAEFLAVQRTEAVMTASVVGAFAYWYSGPLAAVVGAVAAFYVYERSKTRSLERRAARRRQAIRRRFASSIDLMALMMDVGGGFIESLQTVAHEQKGHPLGEEFQRVLQDIEAGRARKQALQAFADRLSDDDAAELIFAVVKGEELGTPLAEILRIQAEQMRQKRSQWAEKASQEAQVTLVYPAMIIMLACLIIVATPFILGGIFTYQGQGG